MAAKKYLTISGGKPLLESANDSSAGAGDAGKLVALGSDGLIAASMLPASALPSISDLSPTHWYKADAGITKDGSDLVSVWADQGSGGKNFAQATGTNQPLWVASSASFNGHPILRFDGTDNFMSTASAIASASTDCFCLVVFQYTGNSGTDRGWAWPQTNAYNSFDGTNIQVYTGAAHKGYKAYTANTPLIYLSCFGWEGNDSATDGEPTSNVWINGGQYFQGATRQFGNAQVGHIGHDGSSNHAAIEFAEIAFWAGADFSLLDITGILHAMSEKYNIALH